MATHYRRFSGQAVCPAPLPTVPNNYGQHLRALGRRLRLTQGGLARRIGAANKAVVPKASRGVGRTPAQDSGGGSQAEVGIGL